MKTTYTKIECNGRILYVNDRVWDFRDSCTVTLSRNTFWAQVSPTDESGFVVRREECREP